MTEPHAERRRGFVAGFGVGATAALGVAVLVVALVGDIGESDLTSEASDTIQDDYFKSVDGSVLSDASVDGMVARAPKPLRRPVLALLESERAAPVRVGDLGPVLRRGAHRHRGQARAPRGDRSPGHPGPASRHRVGGDLIASVNGHSIAGVPAEVSAAGSRARRGPTVELRVVPVSGGPPEDRHPEARLGALPVAEGSCGARVAPASPRCGT